MNKYLFIINAIFFYNVTLLGQIENCKEKKPLSFSALYTGDMISVVSGGLRNGTSYLGMANLLLEFENEKAGLWAGGKIFLNAVNTHGAMPSFSFIGDYQIASNIEAGDRSFIQELWYQQVIGNFRLIFGIQDLNSEFAGCCSGKLFLNSSFGIHPTIATNIPASVFPLTSIGITAIWNPSQNWFLKFAIYDGAPTPFEQNPYNLNWKLNHSEGMINIFETKYQSEKKTIKLGMYHHDHLYEPGEITPELVYEHNIGLYISSDFYISELFNISNLYVFNQVGISSRLINKNYWFFSIGAKLTNLTSTNQRDELGFAVAHAGMRSIKDETTIEFTYKHKIFDAVFIQPDIQYIINPAGRGEGLKSALVFTVRSGIDF